MDQELKKLFALSDEEDGGENDGGDNIDVDIDPDDDEQKDYSLGEDDLEGGDKDEVEGEGENY